MNFSRNIMLFMLSMLLVFVFSSCNSATDVSEESSSDSIGGELKIALNAQPPTIDPQFSTAVATRDVSRLIYETLLTIDSNYQVVPMLAEAVEESDDQLTYTFILREDIKFHNGKEMTAEDVVASMDRWKELSSAVTETLGDITFEAKEKYTVVMNLEEPVSVALDIVASPGQAAAIMPKEVIEAVGLDEVIEHIGTGPYKFVEWKQDQYIHLDKFNDYNSLDLPADGLSGKKEAVLDDIYFYIATDSSTRLAGLQTGEYDLVYQIPLNNFEQVEEDPDILGEPELVGNLNLVYNKQEGLMSDINMRKAVNAALNLEEILTAALINEETFLLNSSYMNPDIGHWASDAGGDQYNQNDPEKAKEYLEKANYNGEELKILTTRDYEYYYNSAIVIKEQLENIGMVVTLEIYDWPTVTELREDPSAWDMLTNGFTFKADPSQILEIRSGFAGGIVDDHVEELKMLMLNAETQEKAKEYWDELQAYAWEEFLPVTKLGNYGNIYGASKDLENYEIFTGPIIWNASFK